YYPCRPGRGGMSAAVSMPASTRRRPLTRVAAVLGLMARNRAGFVGFVVVVVIVVGSFIAPLVVPFDTSGSAAAIYATPSWAHLLGPDHERRDVLAQVLRCALAATAGGFL